MMTGLARTRLAVETAWELLRYDLLYALRGFRGVHASGRNRIHRAGDADLQVQIPKVVSGTCCFYWKRVLCLQRSVVTARVLRRHGFDAEVVIGCRKAPFTGHAWVEIAGAVVNDSPGYQQKLRVLERF